MYRLFLFPSTVLLCLTSLPAILTATKPPSSAIFATSSNPDLDIIAIQERIPAYEKALSIMAAHLPNPIAGNSNTTSFHGTAEWPSAPFSIPSITFDGWSLHIRSYTPAYLSTPQMHALATICVDQIQRYMRFARDGVPWPEQTTIFRPTRRDSHSSYLENVEVMFENREGGQGVLLTVEAVVKTLIIIVNMVVAPSWSEMERMICHDFVGHPVRVESGGGTSPLEIFRQVKLRERTDRGAEG